MRAIHRRFGHCPYCGAWRRVARGGVPFATHLRSVACKRARRLSRLADARQARRLREEARA